MLEIRNIPVLIVGGGPVGLSMALGLARQNIPSIVVERNPGTVEYPRTRGVSTRTMELFRQWGNYTELVKHEQPKEARRFIWLETLQGKELMRPSVVDGHLSLESPVQSSFVTQNHVEDSLYQTLQNHKETQVEFSKELKSFVQDDTGVTACIWDKKTQRQEQVRANYLIAADGAHSQIREALSIAMKGPDDLGRFCSIYFDLDLTELTQHRPCVGFFFTGKEIAGRTLLSTNEKNRWILFLRYDERTSKDDFTDDYCLSMIRRVTNVLDRPIKIVTKSFWTMAAQTATQYRNKRVFLVGDAAHRIPPTGGLGMNTGIQDAHNLAWKIAFVIKYKISDSILDTYFEERLPVADRNIKWSSENNQRYVHIAQAIHSGRVEEMQTKMEEQQRSLNSEGLDMGFIYHSRAVIPERGQEISVSASRYIATTLPGSRAPHVSLLKGNEQISTLDLFEKEFVLLIAACGKKWQEAASELGQLPIPLKIYRVASDGDLKDPKNNWEKKYELSDTGAVLVRPDGHIAWRSKALVDNPKEKLNAVLKQLVG